MTRTAPRIVILGGGTAGWITAALFAKAWGEQGGAITLVEISRDRDHWRWRRLNPPAQSPVRPYRCPGGRVDGGLRRHLEAWHSLHRLVGAPRLRKLFSPLRLPDRPAQRARVRPQLRAGAARLRSSRASGSFLPRGAAGRSGASLRRPTRASRLPRAMAITSMPSSWAASCATIARGAGSVISSARSSRSSPPRTARSPRCSARAVSGSRAISSSIARAFAASSRRNGWARAFPFAENLFNDRAVVLPTGLALQASSRRPMRSRWPRAGAGRSR